VYHITPVANLAAIIKDGELVSDRAIINRGGTKVTIGMSSIKAARLTKPVKCHSNLMVGDCVPFYFCPRSVMLFVIHCANNPELEYRGGQDPIVHLEADLKEVVEWADKAGRKWAFSRTNARADYTEFGSGIENLSQINWLAVAATDFRSADIKEYKQAEFLIHESFPWALVSRIGVKSMAIKSQVQALLTSATHKPPVEVLPEWYFPPR
jgi:hypothetical protein